MSSLKTKMQALLIPLMLAANAHALPVSPSERVKLFATCAGRLSALEEHQRIFDGPASERTADRKALFDDVIAATLHDAQAFGLPGRQALAWQIEAKMALAVLLQSAKFARDPLRAELDRQAARDRINACNGLLLTG